MIKQLLLSTFTFIVVLVQAQRQPYLQWEKSYGGTKSDQASSINQTIDGGYIVLGNAESTDLDVNGNHGGYDFWLLKLDAAGSLQWQKTYGGSGDERAGKVLQTADGGYILAGTTTSTDGDVINNHGMEDAWIVKIDISGNIQWQKSYGGSNNEGANDIAITSDGGYILAGSSSSGNGDATGNHGNEDDWIIKIDASGNIQWQKQFGGSNADQANAVKQTADGGYIIAGITESNDGDVTGFRGTIDYWVLKLSKNGTLQWKRCYGGSFFDWANDVIQTRNGGYVIVGNSASRDGDVTGHHENNATYTDMWVLKLYADGALNWEKSLGGSFDDEAHQVQQMSDGSFIVGGWEYYADGDVKHNNGLTDFWLVNLNNTGRINWEKAFGQGHFDQANSMAVTNDDGFAMAGWGGGEEGGKGIYSKNPGGSNYGIMKVSPYAVNTNISISTSILAGNCSAANSITCILSEAGSYDVQLYRYGVLIDSAANVTGKVSFNHLLPGSYYVTATNNGVVTTSALVALLPVPSGVSASNIISSTAQLNWNSLACADNFIIKYKKQRGNNWLNKTTAGNVSSYVLSNLDASTTYVVKIASHKSKNYVNGTGSFSDSIVFTTSGADNILFFEDFEASNINENTWYKEALDTANAITTSTDVARNNGRSAKFSFNFSDWSDADSLQPKGHRVELHPKSGTVPGRFNLDTGYWIGFSNYFPSSWQVDPTGTIIFQFHGIPNRDSLGGGSHEPALHGVINGNKDFVNIELIDSTGNMFSIGKVPVVKNQWNDWIMHVKFSYTSGFDTIWVNGKRVAAYAGSNFYHVSGQKTNFGPYLKSGIYKGHWGDSGITGQASNLIMYEDAIIIGNNRATYKQINSSFGTTAIASNQNDSSAATTVAGYDAAASSLNLNNIIAYPNPATKTTTLSFNAIGKYTITLRNLAGKILQTKTGVAINGKNIAQFNVSKYASGVYLITIVDEKNRKQTVRLSKE